MVSRIASCGGKTGIYSSSRCRYEGPLTNGLRSSENTDALNICSFLRQQYVCDPRLQRLRHAHLFDVLNLLKEKRNKGVRVPSSSMSAVAPDPELVRRHILMILAMPRSRVEDSRISQRVLYAAACAGSLYFGRDDELLQLRRLHDTGSWVKKGERAGASSRASRSSLSLNSEIEAPAISRLVAYSPTYLRSTTTPTSPSSWLTLRKRT